MNRFASSSAAALVFALLAGVGRTQSDGMQNPRPGMPGSTQNEPFGPPTSAAVREKQEKAQNEERQKRLVADTDKLLKLATQLHDDVGKTDRNVLSLDVIKRADEIERLAHAVKDRMRN